MQNYILALMNSKISMRFLEFLAPTLDFNIGPLSKIPVVFSDKYKAKINSIAITCIEISKEDWDSFETSWDFTRHPLCPSIKDIYERNSCRVNGKELENASKIAWNFERWRRKCEDRFNRIKACEEDINRIFIDIYGLQDELTPEENDEDVTVKKADLTRDIKSFISYAVGCMFGRYSIDRDGLIFADSSQKFDDIYWKYKGQAPCRQNGELTEGSGYAGISLAPYHYPKFRDSDNYETAHDLLFEPDVDNIIPITDEEYFNDDIVGRFVLFVKTIYGDKYIEENLTFIANALGNKGKSSRDVIRKYFLNDFFKDHCQNYSVTGSGKRPIYWLYDSGKQNGFKALIYMHRMDENTTGKVRADYLHRMEQIYNNEVARMQDVIDHSNSAHEVSVAEKRMDKLKKQIKECQEYDAKLGHLALDQIKINLDDGVKVNYRKVQTGRDGKFYEVLADSKNIMANDALWKEYLTEWPREDE